MSKSQSKICSFCYNKGIVGPYDHTIRDFTKKTKPITCPQLLSIQCAYCHENGHTVKYCNVLKTKKTSNTNINNSICYDFNVTNIKKRNSNNIGNIDSDGFINIPGKNNKVFNNLETTIHKVQKINYLTSCFAALDVDNDISDSDASNIDTLDIDNTCDVDMDNNSCDPGVSWAEIVSTKKKVVKNNSLFNAKKNVYNWGDISDDENDTYFGDN